MLHLLVYIDDLIDKIFVQDCFLVNYEKCAASIRAYNIYISFENFIVRFIQGKQLVLLSLFFL